MKSLKSSLVIILLLIPFSLFSQILDGTNNIPKPGDKISAPVNNLPAAIRTIGSGTDEFGTTGSNVFLGGCNDSSYMAVPDASGTFSLTSAGTIEAWVMPTSSSSGSPCIVG